MSNPGTGQMAAWYKFEETSGYRQNSQPDGSGGINTRLTDNNTVGNNAGKHWRSLYSADFNGSNESFYLDDDTYNFLGPTPFNGFSIGLWVKPHGVTSYNTWVAKWTGTNSTNVYLFRMNDSGFAQFYVSDGTSIYGVTASGFGALTFGPWYFIAAYYDDDNTQIGIGVNDVWNTAYAPSTINIGGTGDFYVGRNSAGTLHYLNGQIDDLFIYGQRKLTSAEFTWMYNGGFGREYEDLRYLTPPSSPAVVELSKEEPQQVYVLDNTFKALGVIDDFYSLIWTERYKQAGDFELELPNTYLTSELTNFGNFLYVKNSDHIMVLEDKKPETTETKDNLVVKGRTAAALLDRRVLESAESVSGPAEETMYRLVKENITEPDDTEREVSLFSDDRPSLVLAPFFEEQLNAGTTILEIVESICENSDLGFKILWDDSVNKLYFYVYQGEDHSTSQSDNLWVIFSESFDNIRESSYFLSEREKVNVCVVVTDDSVGYLQKYPVWGETGDVPPSNMLTDLHAWWSLDTDDAFDSHMNEHLQLSGTPDEVSSPRNGALDFEFDSNEHLFKADEPDISPTGSFSAGAWIKAESNSADTTIQTVMSQMDNSADVSSWVLRRTADTNRASAWIASGSTWYGPCEPTSPTLDLNKWYFVVFVYDAENDYLRISINGGDFYSLSISNVTINNVSTKFMIGARQYNTTDSRDHFDGYIDEAFLYLDRKLTEAEIYWLYNEGDGRVYDDLKDISDIYPEDLGRFETFLETSIDRDATSPALSDHEVRQIIITRGRDQLKDEKVVNLFEGDFDIEGPFKYGTDFNMGDIVQCDIQGIQTTARVIELVRSYSVEGRKSVVTLDFNQ